VPHRILYVSAVGAIAGAERSLLELVRALDRSRFEPLAAVPEKGMLAAQLKALDVDVFSIPELRLHRTADPALLASAASRCTSAAAIVAQEARRRRVSLVHSNNTAAQFIGNAAGLMARIPVVWHVRDMRPLGALAPVLARGAAGVIFISRAVQNAVPLPDAPAVIHRVIHNGLDADAFERAARPGALRGEVGIAPETPVLLMAAQMVPWKGHRTFIEAVARVRRHCPGIVALVAGGDLFCEHAQYAAELNRLVSELGLAEAVRFLGYREDMPTLMADCDVLVVPSEGEPFGRVALEAMALGRPVVGTRDGGLPEVVADGRTGMLVPPRDAEAMAAALCTLLDDASLRRALGEGGRRRVRAEFSITDHVRQVQEVYDAVLAGRTA